MDTVTTPDGKMSVASPIRSLGAVFSDFLLAALVVQILVVLLKIFGLFPENVILFAILTLLTFGYPIVSRYSKIPSFGNWVHGVRTYPYSSIKEYSGKGKLVVFVPLAQWEYSQRAIIAAAVLISLILALFALAGGL